MKILENIFDFRIGEKLEIVIPVLNEEKRLLKIIEYYGNIFDIVLLDGGSTDKTFEIAKENRITIFKRLPYNTINGEAYFEYYVKNTSKSLYCFLMMADEFVERENLLEAYRIMKEKNSSIYVKKYDWIFNKRNSKNVSFEPRGFHCENIVYSEENLHDTLSTKNEEKSNVIEMEHFHIWSIANYFGTAGKYAYTEVARFRKTENFFLLFVKRFFISEVLFLPKRMLREIKRGPVYLIWMLYMGLTISTLGILSFIEQKYFTTVEQQYEFYLEKYKN